MKNKEYLLNCFLLSIPLFIWIFLLVDYLPAGYGPELFDKDIPTLISYSENFLRIILFVFPAFMMLSLKSKLQKIGLIIYLCGLLLYFSSWLILITSPESNWSQSLIGFMAPAYTTIVFFIGVGLIGNKTFPIIEKIPSLSLIYICIAILFVTSHTMHSYAIFQLL